MTPSEADFALNTGAIVICTEEGHGRTDYRITAIKRQRDPICGNTFVLSAYAEAISGNSDIWCDIIKLELGDAVVAGPVKEIQEQSAELKERLDIAQRYNLSVFKYNDRMQYKIKEFVKRIKDGMFIYACVLWNKKEPRHALTDEIPIEQITVVPGWDKFIENKIADRNDRRQYEEFKKELLVERKAMC